MNKDNFNVNGVYSICNCAGLEIELSGDGETARHRLRVDNKIIRTGRRQRIKYTNAGRAYITDGPQRIYLDLVTTI